MNVKIVKLHENQEFMSIAVELLNSEWPRSETARLRSLTDSRDDFPCCLLLITQEKTAVVGHSKLTKIHGRPNSVYIENVVVDKTRRGFGYGRKLMELSEDYAHKLGYKSIHLTTHDKCKFYEHLGYQYSSPVSPLRANAKILTPEQFSALQSHFGEKNNDDNKPLLNQPKQFDEENEADVPKSNTVKPQQENDCLHDDTSGNKQNLTTMEYNTTKQRTDPSSMPNMAVPLAPIPPPPVPPPVPPPPFVAPSSKTIANKGKEILYWMVKDL